jgi:hypothetical protein
MQISTVQGKYKLKQNSVLFISNQISRDDILETYNEHKHLEITLRAN